MLLETQNIWREWWSVSIYGQEISFPSAKTSAITNMFNAPEKLFIEIFRAKLPLEYRFTIENMDVIHDVYRWCPEISLHSKPSSKRVNWTTEFMQISGLKNDKLNMLELTSFFWNIKSRQTKKTEIYDSVFSSIGNVTTRVYFCVTQKHFNQFYLSPKCNGAWFQCLWVHRILTQWVVPNTTGGIHHQEWYTGTKQ